MTELALVPIVNSLVPISTAVLYHKEARAYLRISVKEFRQLEKDGAFSRRCHIRGKRPFYLKHELDAYLNNLPRYKIGIREFPKPLDKGAL
jgi:hypothetical protein